MFDIESNQRPGAIDIDPGKVYFCTDQKNCITKLEAIRILNLVIIE